MIHTVFTVELAKSYETLYNSSRYSRYIKTLCSKLKAVGAIRKNVTGLLQKSTYYSPFTLPKVHVAVRNRKM